MLLRMWRRIDSKVVLIDSVDDVMGPLTESMSRPSKGGMETTSPTPAEDSHIIMVGHVA